MSHTDPPKISPSSLATTPFLGYRGRIGRLRYLASVTVLSLLLFVVFGSASVIVLGLLENFSRNAALPTIATVFFTGVLCSIYATCATARRRLHDLGHSGWLSLLLFVPALQVVMFAYLLLAGGDIQANRYGNAPDENTPAVYLWATLGVVLLLILLIGSMLQTLASWGIL